MTDIGFRAEPSRASGGSAICASGGSAVCAAFGYFDGMHRGHLAVLEQLAAVSAKRGLSPALLTFPAKSPVLSTEDEKVLCARSAGITEVLSLPAPEDIGAFIREVLADRLNTRAVILGTRGACGLGFDELAGLLGQNGIEVIAVDTVCADGEPITSERLVERLEGRDPAGCAALCGHPYTLTGTVVHGRGLGHTVGMPTANLGTPPEKRLPADGVYATRSRLADGVYSGLTNIGTRPSVDSEPDVTVETMLFGFDRDIYGEAETLELIGFIRPVRKMNGLQAVREQVELDAERARELLR